MFKVISINENKIIREVYAVTEFHGEINFLIYDMKRWTWMPADLYKPYNED
jgi:hypothetical protein